MKAVCSNPECNNTYTKKKHNHRYCSESCYKTVTNKKLMDDYYKKKDRLAGVKRVCELCKFTKLSRYNKTEVCAECESKKKTIEREELIKQLGLKL